MRRLIAAFKLSLDGRYEGPEGYAGWAEAWSEDYGLTAGIDACLLGGGMYPGYEAYWSGLQAEPDKPAWITGAPPTPAELAWARFAAATPHYVLSSRQTTAAWPNTRFVRSLDDVGALKRQSGKDIYLMGGGRVAARLIDAGLVNELRLIVHPLIAGAGSPFLSAIQQNHALQLRQAEPLAGGKLSLVYGLG
jgi:dihydrofolate reductase